jgi:transcriptional regulator with XRE-family HTH domain
MRHSQAAEQLRALNARRRKLGITYSMLAQRTGIHQVTVQRILSGRHAQAGFSHVAAIAAALGAPIIFDKDAGIEELRERQAWQKAKRLVGMIQATSALEGQGLTAESQRQMTRRIAHQLLAGSRANLWSEP